MRTKGEAWTRHGGIGIYFYVEDKNEVATSSSFCLTRGEAKRLAKQIKDALKNQKRESA